MLRVHVSITDRRFRAAAEEDQRIELALHRTQAAETIWYVGLLQERTARMCRLIGDGGMVTVSAELAKTNNSKGKLEQLCRELQKQNKLIVVRVSAIASRGGH
jgi:hypothetical protein